MEETSQQSTGAAPEQRDVSRQTMVVLVILAIVVSLLGTFTVIKETSGVQRVVYAEGYQPAQTGQGMVSLEIVDRSQLTARATNDEVVTGRVTLKIVERK